MPTKFRNDSVYKFKNISLIATRCSKENIKERYNLNPNNDQNTKILYKLNGFMYLNNQSINSMHVLKCVNSGK